MITIKMPLVDTRMLGTTTPSAILKEIVRSKVATTRKIAEIKLHHKSLPGNRSVTFFFLM